MNTTERGLIRGWPRAMQRWNVIQRELLPELHNEVGPLTPKLETVIYTLEWVRIEEFIAASWCRVGRPPHERSWLANAFVAKTVLRLVTTSALIERLSMDRALRRICGFAACKKLPSESTFSRAFEEFAEARLPERVHEALVKSHLGDALIGHINRDGAAIEARERPARAQTTAPAHAHKRGRPRRGEIRPAAKVSPIHTQRQQSLARMLKDIPAACDRGTKCNAQGYQVSWNGYWWQPLV